MSAPVRPYYVQSLLTTTILIALLLVTFPLSLAFSIYARLFHGSVTRASHVETVLVTGARTQKSLTLARLFWKAGYRVILADEAEWARYAASRFSKSAVRFYTLPDPVQDHDSYESAIRSIIKSERVNLWVPGSSAGATLNDARVAEVVRSQDGVDVFIQSAREIEQLHNKDLFGDLVKDLSFTVPESILVSDIEQAIDYLHSDERKGRQYILKCTALDDQGRSDLTRLPFETREKTRAHFSRMKRRISKSSPYVLQQFISGYEFCTHCHAIDGEMRSFLTCPSSDMLMRYVDCRTAYSAQISEKAEQWTRDFLRRWKAMLDSKNESYHLTGHFSFDFIVDETGTLFPIECNPRIHTAIVLLSTQSAKTMADSYFGRHTDLIKPLADDRAYSWLFHSVPLLLGQAVLPGFAQKLVHPLLPTIEKRDPLAPPILDVTLSPQPRSSLLKTLHEFASKREVDPMFDWNDPMPFAAQHLMWIWLLGRTVFARRQGWSRLNVSTSRIFTC